MKKGLFLLLIFVLIVQTSPLVISAESPNSVINDLYPTEKEMKLETGIEFKYRIVPPEHYKWDSNLKFAEWDGLFPELKNPGDVTENTIWSAIFRCGVALVRFGIFLMHMAFSTNIFTAALSKINGEIAAVSDQFFTKVFPIASSLLIIFMVVAWIRGQKGQMVSMFLTAFIVSTLLLGGIKHIDTFAQATSDIIDELSLAALGILNFKAEGNYADGGKVRLAETSNIIWDVTVDVPWTAGQFGSLKSPVITRQEEKALNEKGISSHGTWKDLFLQYSPGSMERNALVDVISDDDIPHGNKTVSVMMKEVGPPVRALVSILSFLNSLGFLIVAIVVAGLMIISGVLLLGGMVVSPFMAPMPFLASFGMNVVKKYLGSMIGFAVLKVTSLIYLSVLMLLLYLVSLIDWHFFIVQGITLLILAVAIYLSPKIWKRMAPGLAHISGLGERDIQKIEAKKIAPQENLESLYERYGNHRQDRSTEDLLEKSRMNRIRDARVELDSLQELKRTQPSKFTASGLEQREQELKKTLRKDEISKMDLGSLQNERFKYENKLSQGLTLSDAEKSDLSMIQQQERQLIRSLVKPEQQSELDQIWRQSKEIYEKRLQLQQQKAADPLLFARTGGEVKMQYLNDRAQTLREKEHAILKGNSLIVDKQLLASDQPLTAEDRRKRQELWDYWRRQKGDSVMGSHFSNLSPEVKMPERQLYIESLSHDELKAEQEKYHEQMKHGDLLSEEQKNEYLYMQHHDWMKTIDSLDERDTLQNLHFREMDIEAQLSEMDSLRTADFEKFEAAGGEEAYQEALSELYRTRQETQEVLRNSGHSDIANRHVELAEKRDLIRSQPANVNHAKSNVIKLRREGQGNKEKQSDNERTNFPIENRAQFRSEEINESNVTEESKELKIQNNSPKMNEVNYTTISEELVWTDIDFQPNDYTNEQSESKEHNQTEQTGNITLQEYIKQQRQLREAQKGKR